MPVDEFFISSLFWTYPYRDAQEELLDLYNGGANVRQFSQTPSEFRITPSIPQCFKCQGFGHKAQNCTKKQKCVVCGKAHSHKDCPNKNKKKTKCANCRGHHVANYRGCPAYKNQAFRQHVVQNQISYASIVKQASPPPPNNTFNFTAEQIVSLVTNVVSQIAQPQLCTKTLPENKYRQNPIYQNRSQKQSNMFRGQYCRQRCV